jgi:hypothetical protein
MERYKQIKDPFTGIMETYWHDPMNPDSMTIQTTYDCTDVIEANKQKVADNRHQRFGSEMMHHFAEIPNGVVVKFKKDFNIDVFSKEPEQRRRLLRKLEDPEWKYLKTTTAKLFRPT